jgi:hypothetical protein
MVKIFSSAKYVLASLGADTTDAFTMNSLLHIILPKMKQTADRFDYVEAYFGLLDLQNLTDLSFSVEETLLDSLL